MNDLPKIKVIFSLSSSNSGLLCLSDIIKISPTKIRDIDDWPEAIKNNRNLPRELQPCYVWSLEYEKTNCKDVNVLLNELRYSLFGKEQEIRRLVKKNNWDMGITVIVDEYQTNKAYIGLNTINLSFIHSLNCEIGFDISQFEDEEIF